MELAHSDCGMQAIQVRLTHGRGAGLSRVVRLTQGGARVCIRFMGKERDETLYIL